MKNQAGSTQGVVSAATAPVRPGAQAGPAGPGAPRTPLTSPREVVRPQAPLRNVQLGPRAVGSWVPRLTRPAFEKFGFSAAALITDWATIVGSALAAYTAPERLKWPKLVGRQAEGDEDARPAATLVLAVDPGRALDVQYRARQIVERINAYFGYRAVADLRIVQAPAVAAAIARDRAPAPRQPRPLAPPPAEVQAVEDEGLRLALARMAAGLSARST